MTPSVPGFSLDMKRDDRPDETIDSGMCTLQSRGTGPALDLLNTIMDRGTMGVDAPTPVIGQNHWFGPRGGVRPILFGHDMLILIPDAPPLLADRTANRTADLLVTIARLQSEVRTLKLASPTLPTPATWTHPARRRPVTFTNTEVPKFRGVCKSTDRYLTLYLTSSHPLWLNGWDDDTVTLQVLSHMEGDALNVALLVPEVQRATRIGLVSVLNDHYGSPGRLLNCRRQFEKTVRRDGEDPSIFTIELEILAVKAFGDIGQSARVRMIRDRFVTGHPDCDLRRHLYCVLPGTPIRDIVDRCRVWERYVDANDLSLAKPAPERTRSVYTVSEPVVMPTDRVVVAVATPSMGLADLETLLKWLLSNAPAPTPPPHQVPMEIESMLECLLSTAPAPASPPRPATTDMETMLRRLLLPEATTLTP